MLTSKMPVAVPSVSACGHTDGSSRIGNPARVARSSVNPRSRRSRQRACGTGPETQVGWRRSKSSCGSHRAGPWRSTNHVHANAPARYCITFHPTPTQHFTSIFVQPFTSTVQHWAVLATALVGFRQILRTLRTAILHAFTSNTFTQTHFKATKFYYPHK